MDNIQHVKSVELCRRCAFFCLTGRKCAGEGYCEGCELYRKPSRNQVLTCKCYEVKYNTPCPYFEEDEL